MGSEWVMATFGNGPVEIIDGDRGKNYPKQHELSPQGFCLFLNAGNVTVNGFDFSSCAFISQDKDSVLRKGKLKRQDVVLTTRGTVGNAAYFNETVPYEKLRINSGMVILRANPAELLPHFLYLFVRSSRFMNQVASLRTGSAQPQLPIRDIKRIELPVPPLPEQRAIAHILGSLDDKIELNRKMNETLEAMAQALFKSWFIDFDPVVINALRVGNPIPDKFAQRACLRRSFGRQAAHYRDNPGALRLPEDLLRQFPDRFQDSELGPIPEGWEVKPIGDLVKCVGGATPSTKKPEFWEGGTNPFLTPKDMSSLDSPVVLDTERHITDAGVEKISSKKLPIGTVLLSSRAPIGYLAINEVPVSVNQGIIAMICDGPLPNHYVFFWTKNNMDVIKGKAGGTTFAEISKKNFRPIPALQPSEKVLDAFANMVGLLYQQLVENTVSCVTLAKLRDTLLPKLISGELRVPDAEAIIKDVTI